MRRKRNGAAIESCTRKKWRNGICLQVGLPSVQQPLYDIQAAQSRTLRPKYNPCGRANVWSKAASSDAAAGICSDKLLLSKNPIEKIVLLRIADDPGKQRERLCISEHPFGTVKWHHGAHYVLCKGLKKTTAELGFTFLAYNLRRAINMMGVPALLEAMKGV